MEQTNARLAADDRRVEQLLAEARRAFYLRDQRQLPEALRTCRTVIERARALGVECPEMLYTAACLALETGDREASIAYAMEAVRADPLSPPCRLVLDRAAASIRDDLADDDREPDDESTPRLHALLVRAGKADPRSHVALARHLAHAGDTAEALALLAAVTRLSPTLREAWALRGELALATGDLALAEECAVESAAACEGHARDPVPFVTAPFAQA